MSNTHDLHTFDFSGLELRVIMQLGEPWFVATDLYQALFGRTTGISARSFLARDENQVIKKRSAPDALCSLFRGRAHHIALISESGLYRLIMRSDKPEARKFQDWVTREVLPSIRKTGGYLLNEQARDTAHADDRQAMPLPEEFAQLFAKVPSTRSQFAARF